jgi:hypothetical protein
MPDARKSASGDGRQMSPLERIWKRLPHARAKAPSEADALLARESSRRLATRKLGRPPSAPRLPEVGLCVRRVCRVVRSGGCVRNSQAQCKPFRCGRGTNRPLDSGKGRVPGTVSSLKWASDTQRPSLRLESLPSSAGPEPSALAAVATVGKAFRCVLALRGILWQHPPSNGNAGASSGTAQHRWPAPGRYRQGFTCAHEGYLGRRVP